MATYYVRKTGSDAAAGTSAGAAWLTIGKALGAAGIASGDTVYVGPGVYREAVAVAMTSATAETKVIGDVDGSHTGDAPGEVRLTSWTTTDKVAGAGAALDLQGRDFLTFERMSVYGYTIGVTSQTGTALSIVLRDCLVVGGSGAGVSITQAAIGPYSILLERCIVVVGANNGAFITSAILNAANVDYDVGVEVRNSYLMSPNGGAGIRQNVSGGSGTGKPGGMKVRNNTIYGGNTSVFAGSANCSTSLPILVYNNLILGGNSALIGTTNSGQIVEDYNVISAVTPRTLVATGANSISGNPAPYAPLVEFGQALMQGRAARPFMSPTADSPMLGFGSDASVTLTDDLTGGPRPAGGGPAWGSAAKAVGAMERGNSAEQEATTVRTGASAGRITGPGYQDFLVPVDAASTTVSAYLRKDSTYAGTAPTLQVLAQPEIGVSAASDVMTAAADTWDQRSLTFTPTAKGVVTIRVLSSSTAGTGRAFYDDFAVT